MQFSAIPVKFSLTWAQNAPGSNVRTVPFPSQQLVTPGAASFNDGFPPLNSVPTTAGGVPPSALDMNGALRAFSQWIQWQQAGAPVQYDSAFATAIGGYPKGALIASANTLGYYWLCLVDNNMSNPDTGGANWQGVNSLGSNTTGDVKLSIKTTADPGYVMMNDGSIGSATSGASTLASSTTQNLFNLIFNNITDAWAPIQTSSGGATTRAGQGSAATAWNNNCRIFLPLALGRALAIAGAGSGLTSRALGQNLGQETHVLTTGEAPSGQITLNDPGHHHTDSGHTHTITDPQHTHTINNAMPQSGSTFQGSGSGGGGTGAVTASPASTGITINSGTANIQNNTTGITLTDNGGNQGHNNMQPSTFLTAMIAL